MPVREYGFLRGIEIDIVTESISIAVYYWNKSVRVIDEWLCWFDDDSTGDKFCIGHDR